MIECDYAPVCKQTFDRVSRKNTHVAQAHGGAGRIFCRQCTHQLRFFKNENTLRVHMQNHVEEECPRCGVMIMPRNRARHRNVCDRTTAADVDDGNVEEKEDVPMPLEAERVYHPEADPSVERAPHRAPPEPMVENRLDAFFEWYKNPNSLGRFDRGLHSTDFSSKFRTLLGKMGAYFELSSDQLIRRLNSQEHRLAVFFAPERVDGLLQWMGKTKDGQHDLHPTTRYNQLRPLVVFLQWMVEIKGFALLKDVYSLVHRTSVVVSKQRSRAYNGEDKAARIEGMPSVRDFIEWLDTDLLSAFEAQISAWNATRTFKAEMYIAARDYFLVLLLFATPPQRLQLLTNMSLKDAQRSNGMLRFRIREHKTSHLYGPAFLFIPKRFVKLFTKFKILRQALLRYQCKATKNPSLENEQRVFLDLRGCPDKYLTSRFEQLVHTRFNKHVTIRDCRSLYITYAHEHMSDLKDMYELSRLMYHSFTTQQQVYRSSTTDQRLANAETIANRIATLQNSDAIESSAALPHILMDAQDVENLDNEDDANLIQEQSTMATDEFPEFGDDAGYAAALAESEAIRELD